MNAADTSDRPKHRLMTFHERHGATIATWVTTAQDLQWLAPATEMPLTAEKVIGWTRAGGHAFILAHDGDATPIGYAELNPMRRDPDHFWIGHAIVRPDERGRGIGTAFVRALLRHAFDHLGAHRISLIAFPNNAAAIACYRGVGFVPVGEEVHQFGSSGTKHRLLRLEIRPPLVEAG